LNKYSESSAGNTTSKKPTSELSFESTMGDVLGKSRIRVLNLIIPYSIIVMIIFAAISYYNAKYIITILDFITGILLLFLFIQLRIKSNYKFVAHAVIVILGLHYLYLIYSGGMQQMGYIWTFLFPVGVMFFLGKDKGLIYSFAFLFFASILLFTTSAYDNFGIEFEIRYIGIYFTFAIISYAFEHLRTKLNDDLISKNKLLINKINELKEKDKALTEEKENALKAERLKSEFLAQMSHEIRTPINTVLNYTSLIESELKDKLPNDLEHSFDSINNASARLIRTIDLILDLSAIESGALDIKPEKFDLTTGIVLPVINEFKQSAHKKKLSVELIYDPLTPCLIFADKYTVTQTFTNLIHNAIKYTDKGSIRVACTKKVDGILVEITDTGVGISHEYLPNLFEKFSQETQGYTRSYEGNGLGLALVKKYCDINNVKIEVTSKKNMGTTFKLFFNQLF